MDDDFEWEAGKARANLANHRVSFERAREIFKGPRLEVPDTREDYGEDRYISIGMVEGRCLVVAHTPRGRKIRIISARKATHGEQIRYFKAIHNEA